MAGLATIEEALALVLGEVVALPTETVPLAFAAGGYLAGPGCAATDLPPFASSAMDVFAIRSADVPGSLEIVARIAAGRPATIALGPGEAMGIATGGVVPEGADAVVPIESVVDTANTVEVGVPVPAGSNVRPRGGDIPIRGGGGPARGRLPAPPTSAPPAPRLSGGRCGGTAHPPLPPTR